MSAALDLDVVLDALDFDPEIPCEAKRNGQGCPGTAAVLMCCPAAAPTGSQPSTPVCAECLAIALTLTRPARCRSCGARGTTAELTRDHFTKIPLGGTK